MAKEVKAVCIHRKAFRVKGKPVNPGETVSLTEEDFRDLKAAGYVKAADEKTQKEK